MLMQQKPYHLAFEYCTVVVLISKVFQTFDHVNYC